jgi:peptidoglycan/LPS O-acetylase OafA/YrhL
MNPSDSSTRTRSWGRLDAVDILRGLAIFFVLMNHVNMRLWLAKIPYTQGLPDQLVSSLVWNGQYGVQIFFAVSGFLITSTSLRRWGEPSRVNVRDFYVLRFARIAPLLLMLLLVLSALHAAGLKDFVVSAQTGGLGRAWIAALTLHVNLLEARRGYLPGSWDVLWSLSIEEMFYLFFPLLCRFVGRGKGLVGVLVVFVVLGPFGRTVFAHGNDTWQEYSYLGGMDGIALGCLTALMVARIQLSRRGLRVVGGLGIASLIFILGFSLRGEAWGLADCGLDMTIVALGTCMIITSAAGTRRRSPRIAAPLMKLGRHSYEIYLTHMFVVFALFNAFVSLGSPSRLVPVLFVGVIVASGLLGALVARCYSEPMNRRLRNYWGDGANRLGSVIDAKRDAHPE